MRPKSAASRCSPMSAPDWASSRPPWPAGVPTRPGAPVAATTPPPGRRPSPNSPPHAPGDALPYDAEVIGAVRESATDVGLDSADNDIVVCAAGTLPAELHKL